MDSELKLACMWLLILILVILVFHASQRKQFDNNNTGYPVKNRSKLVDRK